MQSSLRFLFLFCFAIASNQSKAELRCRIGLANQIPDPHERSLLDRSPQDIIENASDEEFNAYLSQLEDLKTFFQDVPHIRENAGFKDRYLKIFNSLDFWKSRIKSNSEESLSDIELLMLMGEPSLLSQYKTWLQLARLTHVVKTNPTTTSIKKPFSFISDLWNASPHANALKNTEAKLLSESETRKEKVAKFLERPYYYSLYKFAFLGTAKTAWNALKALGHVLNPLPPFISVPSFFRHKRIAMRQYKNPHLNIEDFSRADQEYLSKRDLKEAFEARKKFLLNNPAKAKAAHALVNTYKSVLSLSYLAASSVILNQDEDDYISIDEVKKDYIEDGGKKYAPNKDEVQVIVNLAPFPHLAIRIGERVFSYSYERVDILPWAEYYMSPQLNKMAQAEAKRKGELPPPSYLTPIKDGFADILNEVNPSALQVATLKLGEDEVKALERDLLDQHAKIYKNIPQVNDCATMAMRALRAHTSFDEEFTKLIDASPSQSLMYFSVLKSINDPRVKNIQTIFQEKKDSVVLHKARNFIVNNAESKLFLTPMPFIWNQSSRFYFDQENPSKDNIQFRSEEDEKTIQEVSSEFANHYLDLDKDGLLSLYAGSYRYGAKSDLDLKKKFRARAQIVIDQQRLILEKLPALKRKNLEAQINLLEACAKDMNLLDLP